jgi:hypothetical protein
MGSGMITLVGMTGCILCLQSSQKKKKTGVPGLATLISFVFPKYE